MAASEVPPAEPAVNLGALQSRHTLARGARNVLIVLGVCYVIGWLVLPIAGYVMGADTVRTGGTLGQALILPLSCAGIWLAPGLAVGWAMWWKGNREVDLYEKGVTIRNRQGVTAIPWESITDFTTIVSARYRTVRGHRLTVEGGRKYRIDSNLEGFEQLSAVVVPRAQEAVVDHLWQTLQSGQRLNLAGVGLDKEGLHLGSKLHLRWADIDAVQLKGAEIWYQQGGQWQRWVSLAVAPPSLLVALGNALIRAK